MRRTTRVLLLLIVGALISSGALAQDDRASLVAGNTLFAFDLYAAVRQEAEGNLVFTPFSVSQALAMTYAGADGATAAQMVETLGFSLPQPVLHETFGALNADLAECCNAAADPDEGQTARALRIANALWGEETYPFSPSYSALLEQYYGAGLRETDVKNAPEEARQEINAWVAEQTEDRIEDIVPEGAIVPDTRLVLANVISFYGGWWSPFEPGATEEGDFFLLDGATATVPFMVQGDSLRYARGDGFQASPLPYQGSGLAFTILLPEVGQFAAFEAGLAAAFDAAMGQLAYTDVVSYLPRFEFEFGASLAQQLQAMGMTDAFDPMRSDCSAMADGTLTEPLVISDVLHRAFIGVDEHGTEAAATVVIMEVAGAAPDDTEPTEIRIDRPFIFAIRDTQTGTVLFLGRVIDPRG